VESTTRLLFKKFLSPKKGEPAMYQCESIALAIRHQLNRLAPTAKSPGEYGFSKGVLSDLSESLADTLACSNPDFGRNEFLAACGFPVPVEETEVTEDDAPTSS
jgi:hypothetical protein